MKTSNGLLCAFALLIALPASAQINTEKLRGSAEPGFHGWIDGSLQYRSGNAPRVVVSSGARLEYVTDEVHTTFVQGAFNYGQKGEEGDAYLNKGFGHARWTAMWHPRVGTEVFTQLQFDQFLRLSLRVLGGAGVRGEVLKTDPFSMIMGAGYMIEREDLDIDETNSHPAETLNHRLTSYLLLRLHLTEHFSLISTTYFQPRLDEFSDYRLLEEAGLEVSLVKHLSLVAAFTMAHDADPPDGVEKTDIVIAPKLKVHW